MQGFLRAGLVVACLVLVFSSGGFAFEVSSVSIEPKNSATPCDPILGSFTITSFSTIAGTDLLSDGEFSTDIDRPKWSLVLYTEGTETSRVTGKGRTILLSSLNISGSGGTSFKRKIVVNLSGRIPKVERTKNITVIRIRQLDSTVNGVDSLEKSQYSKVVVNCKCIPESCTEPEYFLEPLRDHIEERSNQGFDTTASQEKYTEARSLLYSNPGIPAYYPLQIENRSRANDIIDEGEYLLIHPQQKQIVTTTPETQKGVETYATQPDKTSPAEAPISFGVPIFAITIASLVIIRFRYDLAGEDK